MKDKKEKRRMRLETERNIYCVIICIGLFIIICGIIISYINGLYPLWMATLIIIIFIIVHVSVFIYFCKYYKKKIEIRKSRGYIRRS